MTRISRYFMIVAAAAMLLSAMVSGCGTAPSEGGQQTAETPGNDTAATVQQSEIDTCTAYFRRHTWADKKHNITFDRIEILTGNEAVEYASQRHGFEGRKSIIINLETTTSTMSVSDDTEIWIINPKYKPGNSQSHYVRGTISDVVDFEYNTILKLATQEKIILYLQELDVEL